MTERPILFNGPMVKALLEGRKTQTRRIVKPQPEYRENKSLPNRFGTFTGNGWNLEEPSAQKLYADYHCPYGKPGDRLWVREAWTGSWHPTRQSETHMHIAYAADGGEGWRNAPADYLLPKAAAKAGSWVTPLFMPRWASRITLEVTEVRVQQLQDISEEDAIAEGISVSVVDPSPRGIAPIYPKQYGYAKDVFRDLWESINGPGSWDANPWVWAVSFKREAK